MAQRALSDFHAWTDELGLVPGRRGLSAAVSNFLRAEATGDAALAAAPVVLGVLVRDPGGEPTGLIGRLVDHPPQGSLAVRKFALETVGLTNRPEYLSLLERVAAEPGPFAALAIRAAGFMDGGTAVLRRAIEAHPAHPHASVLIHALSSTVDHAPAADLVRGLARGGDGQSLEIALRVLKYRGALPDLAPVIRSASSNRGLSDTAREDAQTILAQTDPELDAIHNPAGGRPEKPTPEDIGGR